MTVFKWSQTAATNASADSTINFAEGMAPSAVNDSCRAVMAAIAKWRDDIGGLAATAGSSTAYTYATSQVLSATPNNGTSITFFVHTTNGASATLRVDGGGIFPLMISTTTAAPAGVLNPFTPYSATFNSSINGWILNNVYNVTGVVPVGTVMPFAGTTDPSTSFLLCDGRALTRTGTYATLFALVGTSFGLGSGGTGSTFGIPDLRGRVVAGMDATGTRLTGATMAPNGNTLGATGGTETHIQTLAEMANHNHTATVTDPQHFHSITNVNAGATVGPTGGGGSPFNANPVTLTTDSKSTGITVANTAAGSSTPMSWLQPTLLLNHIIRAV